MNIVFATSQSPTGSTVRGRVMPLAQELASEHAITVLVLNEATETGHSVKLRSVGREPFERTAHGKVRLSGLALVFSMLSTAWQTARELQRLKPDRVILVKPLPSNTLGVWLWRQLGHRDVAIILDADDFELEANVLTSLVQRWVLHVSEHAAVRMAGSISVATPFLEDRYAQLTIKRSVPVSLIPTGVAQVFSGIVPTSKPVLLYLGSLSVASGHRVDMLPLILQEVRKSIPEATLLIAGHGDDEVSLREQSGVTLLGSFDETQLPSLLQQAAVILDPIDTSITCRAKSSFRVTLAMAAGMPVVSSMIGIRSDLIPAAFHERFFAIATDSTSYAAKAVALLAQPLSEAEKKSLQEHAHEFTWPVLASTFKKLLKA